MGKYVDIALMSCAHLTNEERNVEMRKANSAGIPLVVGTIGENGSYSLFDDEYCYTPAIHAINVIDTMGAGDAYFAALLCDLLDSAKTTAIIEMDHQKMINRIKHAMAHGANFAAKMCAKEGAFGYGIPIQGRTHI